jgi:hypothetical protein
LDNGGVIAIFNDVLGKSGGEPAVYAINGYKFAPLEKNKLYLVAPTDASGRAFFTELTFIHCDSSQSCVVGGVSADPPHNLSEELVDIDGDGVDEIVVKELAGGYEGVRTLPAFTYSIYRIASGQAVDVSDHYPGYYTSTILPRMKADADAVKAKTEQQSTTSPVADALIILVQDDYRRRILKQQTAGLEHATQWAHSGNERLELLAIRYLSTLQSSAADDALSELTKNPNKSTAELASIKLRQKQDAKKINQPDKPKAPK